MFQRLVILNLVSLVTIRSQQREAPVEWVDPAQIGNSYYYFSSPEETGTYTVASRKCREVGGHLATFSDNEEFTAVTEEAGVRAQVPATTTSSLQILEQQNYPYYVGYASASWKQGIVTPEAYYNYTLAQIDNDTGNAVDTDGDGIPDPTVWSPGSHGYLNYSETQIPGGTTAEYKFAPYEPGNLNQKLNYLCEREIDSCSCSKVNEPVIRTFDGQPIQLDAYCQYTLLDFAKFKVEIRTKPAKVYEDFEKDTVGQYPALAVFIDQVRILRRDIGHLYIVTRLDAPSGGPEILIFDTDGTPHMLADDGTAPFTVIDTWNDNDVQLQIIDNMVTPGGLSGVAGSKTNPLYLTSQIDSATLKIYYDGVSVDVALDQTTASNGSVKGLCGTCNDAKQLIGGDGVETLSTYAYGYSWISEVDQCPASMYRPAACLSDLMYRKAVERCQPLIDITHDFNIQSSGCISKYVLRDLKDRENLFTACVSSTCEFGPRASCYYFLKALWYCGYSDSAQDQFFLDAADNANDAITGLDCQPDQVCSKIEKQDGFYDDSTTFNGTCYRLWSSDPETKNAYSAERFCQERYGHLVAVHSKEELENLQDQFLHGAPIGSDDSTEKFWIGRVYSNQPAYHKYNKETNLDGSRSDFQVADARSKLNLSPLSDEGPCVVMTTDEVNVWNTRNCSAQFPGVVCSYKAYTPCGDDACFYPQKCDSTSSTCYDPCFDQGFYSQGRCLSMLSLPDTPNTQTRPKNIPEII